MAAATSKLRLLKSRPLCIICAKPQEAEIIAKTLEITEDHISGLDIPEINDGHSFYLGSFTIGEGEKKRSLEYYVTSSLRQGIQAFATHASVLFHVLRPQFAVHAGVCAGYQAKGIKLKDVVFGDAAFNYEEGKWIVENDRKVFQPQFSKIEMTAGNISSFAKNKDEPTYKYGTYISGSAVRQDADGIFKQLGDNVDRYICALDMEASAFLMLCTYFHIGCLGVVKGVSDLGDSNTAEHPDTYEDALKKTAHAIRKWSIYYLATVQWKINEDFEAGAHIVKGYYDNFIRVVLDAVGGEHDVAIKKSPGKKVKGMMIIMPENDDPHGFAEHGHIARIVKDSDLLEVTVGGGNLARTLYYKAGYLIDFPRVINGLVEGADAVHQTRVFQRALKMKPYFKSTFSSGSPLATVESWQEYEKFLQKNPGPEKFDEETLLL